MMAPQVTHRPRGLALTPSPASSGLLYLLLPALILGFVESQIANVTKGDFGTRSQTFGGSEDNSTAKPANESGLRVDKSWIEVELQNNETSKVITEDNENFQEQEDKLAAGLCQREVLVQHSDVLCGGDFHLKMASISRDKWCVLEDIIRPYNDLTICLEKLSEIIGCFYPNPEVQDFFIHIHSFYFQNCSQEDAGPVDDAPRGLVIALTLVPVGIIPILVYLVVWKSKSQASCFPLFPVFTAKTTDCYEGIGLYYRGTVSESSSGRRCEPWDSDFRRWYMSADVNAGRHNYCRNLQYKRRPWCFVRKNLQLVEEYCNIPRCGSASVPAPPSPAATDPAPAAESTCGRRSRRKQAKIVGGTVSTVESHPWVAAIFWRSKSKEVVFRCGGSLISACWVLTAAHCFPDGSQTRARRFSVSLGKNALNESDPSAEQTFRVEEVIVHEGFDNSNGSFDADIALLKLKAKDGKCAEESGSVRTVCLPPPRQRLLPGITCEIAGYGKEKYGLWYRSQLLREARVNLLADESCRHEDYYGNMITDNMFCAGRPDWSQDACEGDSGGPLVCEVGNRLFQFGVISWGEGCARENRPGVYTRVTNYNRWIAEKTGLPSITAGATFPQK